MNIPESISKTFSYRVIFSKPIKPDQAIPESSDRTYSLDAETIDDAAEIMYDTYREDADNSWTAWILYEAVSAMSASTDVDENGYTVTTTVAKTVNRVAVTHRRKIGDYVQNNVSYKQDVPVVEKEVEPRPKPAPYRGKLVEAEEKAKLEREHDYIEFR